MQPTLNILIWPARSHFHAQKEKKIKNLLANFVVQRDNSSNVGGQINILHNQLYIYICMSAGDFYLKLFY